MTAPVAQQRVVRYTKPQMSTGKKGELIVRHREFVSDIVRPAGAGFQLALSVPVQPGDINAFPWLSRIANNYETYVFENLSYEICTSTATSSEGSLGMMVDYDCTDQAPTSKVEAMAAAGSVRSPVWKPSIRLTCAKQYLHKLKERYTRVGSSFSGDKKMYDTGMLYVYTYNAAPVTAYEVGDLYVEYTVRLSTPQMPQLSSLAQETDMQFQSYATKGYVYQSVLRPTVSEPETPGTIVAVSDNLTSLKDYSFGSAAVEVGSGKAESRMTFNRSGHYKIHVIADYSSGGTASRVFDLVFPVPAMKQVAGWAFDRITSAATGQFSMLLFVTVTAPCVFAIRHASGTFGYPNLFRMVNVGRAPAIPLRAPVLPQSIQDDGQTALYRVESLGTNSRPSGNTQVEIVNDYVTVDTASKPSSNTPTQYFGY